MTVPPETRRMRTLGMEGRIHRRTGVETSTCNQAGRLASASDDTTAGSGDATTIAGRPGGDPPENDPQAVYERIRERAEAVASRERETAERRLASCGELTGAQREIVDEMTLGIVEEVLIPPREALEAIDDPDELEAVLGVFAPDDRR